MMNKKDNLEKILKVVAIVLRCIVVAALIMYGYFKIRMYEIDNNVNILQYVYLAIGVIIFASSCSGFFLEEECKKCMSE